MHVQQAPFYFSRLISVKEFSTEENQFYVFNCFLCKHSRIISKWCCVKGDLKVSGFVALVSAIIQRETMSATLDAATLSKRGLLLKERICSSWSKFFHLSVDSIEKGGRYEKELLPLKVCPVALSHVLQRLSNGGRLTVLMVSVHFMFS